MGNSDNSFLDGLEQLLNCLSELPSLRLIVVSTAGILDLALEIPCYCLHSRLYSSYVVTLGIFKYYVVVHTSQLATKNVRLVRF